MGAIESSQALSSYRTTAPGLSATVPGVHPAGVPTILVSDLSPTATQRWIAWGIIVFVYATLVLSMPFQPYSVGVVHAFVPAVHVVVCFTGFVAAAFLFTQYAVQPQPAFLALAGGYMLGGLFAFFQSLAFPGAYSATGLFGGPSAAGWLFLMWRTSFALGVLAYVLTRRPATSTPPPGRAAMPIAVTIACVVIGACLLTWVMTAMERNLPTLFTNDVNKTSVAQYLTVPVFVLSLVPIFLLARRGTLLDIWLIVTLSIALPDIILPGPRFTVGYYVVRSYELISNCAVLIALLTEASALYARLATAKALQVYGEAERHGSLAAATGAIAHELRQPLNAIRINAHAGQRLLQVPNAALNDVAEILNDIDKDASRANDVMDRVREMVGRQKIRTDAVDVNAVVSDVAQLVSEDAARRHVQIITGHPDEPSYVDGDRTQVVQVLMNLMVNAMDAMDAVPPLQRRLTVRTAKSDGAVVISVSDCGCGISPENLSRIFDPFFTTRSGGMGLGLAISERIVIAHKGRIWAENNSNRGATVYFSLPIWACESGGPVKKAN